MGFNGFDIVNEYGQTLGEVIMGAKKNDLVTYKNGNHLDNRKQNLTLIKNGKINKQ